MATLEELTAEPKSGSGQPSMSLHEEPSPGQPSMSLHEESSPGQPSMSLHEEPSPGQPSMSLHEEPSPGQPSMSLHEESSPGQPSMSLHEEPSPGQPSMSLHEESSSGQPSMSLHESSPGQPSMSLHESSSGQASMGLHEEPSSGQPSMSLHQPSPGQPSMSLHQPSCGQASMSLHEPSSEQSQDISHVLANIFKDAYTKEIIGRDVVSNLSKTKNGISGYHEKYVEELEKIHSEYGERMKQATMLERHIIQARVRASARETQAQAAALEEVGETYHQLGLPPVRSTFLWCVDNDLLKRNRLICPQDYLPRRTQPSQAPEVRPSLDYAKPTFSHSMRVCRAPQDDGYAAPSASTAETDAADPQEGSECSLTLESSSDVDMKRKSHSVGSKRRPSKPKRASGLSGKSLAEERDALRKLKERQNFLRNPRFLPPHVNSLVRARSKGEESWRGDTALGPLSTTDESVPVFQANPQVVFFTEYTVGQVYETSVELKNLTASCRHVRVLPPTTTYFSIGLGRFPGQGGTVAPGMSCKHTVRFAPDSLADYEDYIVVETQAPYPLLVPLVAWRPPPILTLPRVLHCGYSLVGGVKFVEHLVRNEGLSTGTFCIIPKSQWPASNLRSVVMSSFAEEPPFAISPSLFQLQPGQATMVEVVFFPTADESFCQDFTIVCDNCQVKYISVQGEGQSIALELISVSGEKTLPVLGEVRDRTAEHFVRFASCNPHCVERKAVVIRNNTDLDLPFFWQIMRPNLQLSLPGEEADLARVHFHPATGDPCPLIGPPDDVFHVCPVMGRLAPRQDQEFEFSYLPQELQDHHSVCQLVVRDVPQCPTESSDDGAPRISDVIVMEIEVKGSTEPYRVRLEPYAIVFPGKLFIGTATRVKFKMWNHSKAGVRFRWEGMNNRHIMEVEPCRGEIEVNACVELDLVVTGGRPERVVTSLPDPSLDLGLLRLGEESHTTVLLTNTSPLEASWEPGGRAGSGKTRRRPSTHRPPAAWTWCSRTRACQHFNALLELSVEQGTGCYLSVQADVQTPRVCLLSRELAFSDLYVGVPARGVVSLFNQTLLPAHFTWTSELQGKQAALCSASFHPPAGRLDAHATVDVTVEFTSHTDSEVRDVVALCSVQGVDLPVILSFSAKAKTLCVSYSVPSQSSSSSDVQMDASSPLLDFGDEVVLKRDEVTLQLAITNHSAIAAPFRIEAEYFAPHAPASSGPNSQSEKGFKFQKKPLHSVQAKKLQEEAHKEPKTRKPQQCHDFLSVARRSSSAPATGTLAPFETRLVDVTAYSDMWGEYRDRLVCRVGDLQPRLIPVRVRVSGCPLYFRMSGPRPADQHRGPITTHPQPYDIRVDWETYNVDDDKDRKLLDVVVAYGDAFPLKDADGNELDSVRDALPNEGVQPVWERETPSSERTSPPSSDPSQGKRHHPRVLHPADPVGAVAEARCVGLALGFMSLDSKEEIHKLPSSMRQCASQEGPEGPRSGFRAMRMICKQRSRLAL
ncbi:Deleted in lung and esophageal cancer protein 1 [Merluccius polli]|uniref:Deleted in lung and esophageal cancer protein 1 n=1 Tax=Merluccius polli TaxID=89951 RepID=A0AA47MFS8_MERPO|nr:Deleted in lung and esophageal cancer protein 1 [Merluccius polli]